MDWGKLLYATNRMQFCLFVVFQFEEKKHTFPLLVCYSQLSEMNSLSHPQNVLWLKAFLMHWTHSTHFSSGPKTLVTRQFQHMPFPPHLPAATHNSIGQNVCKNSQKMNAAAERTVTWDFAKLKWKKWFTTTYTQLQGNLTVNSVHMGGA